MSLIQSVRTRLRKYASSRMRDRVRRSKIEKGKIPGPPPTADRQILADITQELLGSPPRTFEHASISGYKKATAYVVWMTDASGSTARAFFKDVDLSPEGYPAIVGFPGGRPGLPEAAIYGNPGRALRSFLPPVHAHVELVPEGHYQYYLADLNLTHRFGFRHGDILWAIDHLFDVSSAIRNWIDDNSADHMIRYDGEFATTFVGYTRDALHRFHEFTDDARAARLLERFDDVIEVYLAETPEAAEDAVHGDYRRDNMFHQRGDPTKITVVDWEYAGLGWIHNDVVSLLKMAGPETVDAALDRIAAARPERTRDEHWRLYQRCRLERGLLDAALTANQRLGRSEAATLADSHFERVNNAFALLTNQPTPPIR